MALQATSVGGTSRSDSSQEWQTPAEQKQMDKDDPRDPRVQLGGDPVSGGDPFGCSL